MVEHLKKIEHTCIHHEKKNPWGVASAGAHSSAHRMWLELGLRGLFWKFERQIQTTLTRLFNYFFLPTSVLNHSRPSAIGWVNMIHVKNWFQATLKLKEYISALWKALFDHRLMYTSQKQSSTFLRYLKKTA